MGARIRELRRTAGLTQSAVAAQLGTTQSAVARLEAGGAGLSLSAVGRVGAVLGCDVSVVFTPLENL